MFSTITQYSVTSDLFAVAQFTRPVTSTAFNANAGTLRLTTAIVIGGGIIGGPSSITVTYSFTDLSFDRIRGTSMLGTATPQMLDMRRPAQPIGCKSPLPITITQSHTPQPTPPTPFPTPFPTPATTATPTPRQTPVQFVSSTTVTVPSSLSPATAANTVSAVSDGGPLFESNLSLPIGLGVAGGILLLCVILIIAFVLVKRGKRKSSIETQRNNDVKSNTYDKTTATTSMASTPPSNNSIYERVPTSHYDSQRISHTTNDDHYNYLTSNEV
jgi:hypothetical protein